METARYKQSGRTLFTEEFTSQNSFSSHLGLSGVLTSPIRSWRIEVAAARYSSWSFLVITAVLSSHFSSSSSPSSWAMLEYLSASVMSKVSLTMLSCLISDSRGKAELLLLIFSFSSCFSILRGVSPFVGVPWKYSTNYREEFSFVPKIFAKRFEMETSEGLLYFLRGAEQ